MVDSACPEGVERLPATAPGESRIEHAVCNLCGADGAQPLFKCRDALTGAAHDFAVVRCGGCGLTYIDPRPVPEDMGRFYPRQFVSYQFEAHDGSSTLGSRVLRAVARFTARQRFRSVERFAKLGPASRVLDIGCGKGGFLSYVARHTRCQVTGIDFDAESVRYCRDRLGVRALEGRASDLAQSSERFDLVTMWHFLEHDYDPLGALRVACKLLATGGLLVIEVPNADSLENRLFGEKSYLYDVPRHLYDFSPDTLSRLIDKAGLRLQALEYPCCAGGWIGSLQNLLLGGRLYRDLERHAFQFLLLAELCAPVDFLAARAGRGSIMRAFVRNPG